jgi:hypothetical protein
VQERSRSPEEKPFLADRNGICRGIVGLPLTTYK